MATLGREVQTEMWTPGHFIYLWMSSLRGACTAGAQGSQPEVSQTLLPCRSTFPGAVPGSSCHGTVSVQGLASCWARIAV